MSDERGSEIERWFSEQVEVMTVCL